MGKLLNKHKLVHQIDTWINFFPLCQKWSMAELTQPAEMVYQQNSTPKPETKSWSLKMFPCTLASEFEVYLHFKLLGKSSL